MLFKEDLLLTEGSAARHTSGWLLFNYVDIVISQKFLEQQYKNAMKKVAIT